MKQRIPLDQAVGMVLPHDITEIVPGTCKGPAFRKGHIIRLEDLEHLRRLGKEHIYVLELAAEDIHENEAANLMAAALAGSGLVYDPDIREGKASIRAAHKGLLKVDVAALFRFNCLGEVVCSTLHNNSPVQEGEQVAAVRLIPLVGQRQQVMAAVALAEAGAEQILRVLPLAQAKVALVITGSEVYYGRIEDKFEQVLRSKVSSLGSELVRVAFAPDDVAHITKEIQESLAAGANLIISSGGMSVDPDDVTRLAIGETGAVDVIYGTPVLPGSMFLLGRLGTVPIIGLPACGMFHKITVLDLVLPRILAGEVLRQEDFAALGHGGLCRNCSPCHYPSCSFGK